MKKFTALFLCSILFNINLFSDEKEVASYTAQKHKVDFYKQEAKVKEALTKEYDTVVKLSQNLEKDIMKNDINLRTAKNILTVDIWSEKFLRSYVPTDTELKELYKAEKPRIVAKYELRNILVTYEENADKIIAALNRLKNKKDKQESFIKYVKSVSNDLASKQKDGLTDLVDVNKLNIEVITALKDKNEGDIVKVNLKDVGTQIIFIEKFIPEKDASYIESEEALINLAKRKALAKEMDLLLK
ncbi:MAG: peptidylprolyl isomerase [Aliarcobacter sp.]|nr:peptidylprolyl isomerase [Aliarcobacter sp.]